MSLTWNGDKVIEKVQKACRYGIDKTMAKCIVAAKDNYYPGHGFVTGALQGSIRMKPAVTKSNGETVGEWGSFSINYAERIERGTGKTDGQGQLQGAADHYYPKLAEYVKEGY